jgi:hypothetical protein
MRPRLGFSRGISILQTRREVGRTQAGILHALPELRETCRYTSVGTASPLGWRRCCSVRCPPAEVLGKIYPMRCGQRTPQRRNPAHPLLGKRPP